MKNCFSRILLATALITLICTWAVLPLAAADDPVVAEIGSEKLTLSQFHTEIKGLPPNLKQMASDKKMQKEFLEQLATSHLIYQEGIKQGIDKEPLVQSQIEDTTRKIVLATLLQREIESRIKTPTEKDIEQYYQTHADEFKQEKQVRARHILVENEATAKKIAAKLKDGADFVALAKESSSCPSSAKGGDLGFFTHDRMVKEFADVAFKLKKGETSDPVKTKFGYHIIQVVDIKESGVTPLAEVKTAIENKLIQTQKSQVFQDYIAGLKKKSKFVLHPELIGE
ncbi:MAG: peptidylprolyl isomerase [Deltaproteobacteria bacterium]|nr:peptidylprolyl isomerase [Candidatus Tharpella sp.]